MKTVHMSKIINEKNDLDQIVDANTVVQPIERVMKKEITEAFKDMKIAKNLVNCKNR